MIKFNTETKYRNYNQSKWKYDQIQQFDML